MKKTIITCIDEFGDVLEDLLLYDTVRKPEFFSFPSYEFLSDQVKRKGFINPSICASYFQGLKNPGERLYLISCQNDVEYVKQHRGRLIIVGYDSNFYEIEFGNK